MSAAVKNVEIPGQLSTRHGPYSRRRRGRINRNVRSTEDSKNVRVEKRRAKFSQRKLSVSHTVKLF